MKTAATAESLLELVFWTLERLSHPTFANLTESFEEWEYRTKLRPHFKALARSGYVTLEGRGPDRSLKLTERGRLVAVGGVDPIARWRRKWDGKWRLLTFDLPASQTELRMRLWRWLRSQRFGYLQQSVWISPDPVDDTLLPLKHLKLSPESYTVIEGQPVPPDCDGDLVRGGWDFLAIHRAYSKVIELCERASAPSKVKALTVTERRQWLANQRIAWLGAIALDPLLPGCLSPEGYLGQRAWEARARAFEQIVKQPG
ncbi:MAG: hypothetical protein HYY24_01095 [Verrucomicrobia bacterium]|nr:hypothetical protein [Verrucomicrobiota bacterium]